MSDVVTGLLLAIGFVITVAALVLYFRRSDERCERYGGLSDHEGDENSIIEFVESILDAFTDD